jgi:hypothetical protein
VKSRRDSEEKLGIQTIYQDIALGRVLNCGVRKSAEA